MCKFPCSSTTKLLLQAGADPQAVDRAKNTPLHIIVTYKKIVSDFLTLHAIIMALLDHGVHIDSVNAAGQTPLSAASTGVAEIILKSQADMSLKCLAAQSIRKYNLNYIGQVSVSSPPTSLTICYNCRFPRHWSPSSTYTEPNWRQGSVNFAKKVIIFYGKNYLVDLIFCVNLK